MDIFKSFATDEAKEVDGAWFDVPGGDARIKVARSNNPKYAKEVVKAYEKYQKVPKVEDEIAERQQEAEYLKLLAKHILVGWEKIQFKGEELKYSVANAEMLLKIRDFRVLVQKCADDFEAFRVKQEEEVGNE